MFFEVLVFLSEFERKRLGKESAALFSQGKQVGVLHVDCNVEEVVHQLGVLSAVRHWFSHSDVVWSIGGGQEIAQP